MLQRDHFEPSLDDSSLRSDVMSSIKILSWREQACMQMRFSASRHRASKTVKIQGQEECCGGSRSAVSSVKIGWELPTLYGREIPNDIEPDQANTDLHADAVLRLAAPGLQTVEVPLPFRVAAMRTLCCTPPS